MKNYILIILGLASFCLVSCNNDDAIDTNQSIFSPSTAKPNEFDEWLLDNYTYPYNVSFKYRMQDIESDQTYNLIPAEYEKSVALAQIIKHVWMDAYTELAGTNFLRQYIPKTFHLIGSGAYDSSGTMVLGTAEGGKKITLYGVNELDTEDIDIDLLNQYYFKTMHHEFAHILHQKRNYDTAFDRVCEGKYIGSDLYFYIDEDGAYAQRTDDVAWKDGFVTAYAMSESREDFVENIAMYVTNDENYWQGMLQSAGSEGAAIIQKKFDIVYSYMYDTWGIDLNKLRAIVLRRQAEIEKIDLTTIH